MASSSSGAQAECTKTCAPNKTSADFKIVAGRRRRWQRSWWTAQEKSRREYAVREQENVVKKGEETHLKDRRLVIFLHVSLSNNDLAIFLRIYLLPVSLPHVG